MILRGAKNTADCPVIESVDHSFPGKTGAVHASTGQMIDANVSTPKVTRNYITSSRKQGDESTLNAETGKCLEDKQSLKSHRDRKRSYASSVASF